MRENERLAARIEAAFAHDYPMVKATTNATVQNASARFGKVQQLLALVAAGVLLCAASVLISVLAHAATQRRPRFALLQVLGFKRSTMFTSVALEGVFVIVIGRAVGTALGLVAAHCLTEATTVGCLLGVSKLKPPAWAWLWMCPWLAGLLIAALVVPARLIRRVRATDY